MADFNDFTGGAFGYTDDTALHDDINGDESPTPRHTQFLDLTNGEGGSRPGAGAVTTTNYFAEDDDEDDGGGGGLGVGDIDEERIGLETEPPPPQQQSSSRNAAASNNPQPPPTVSIDPGTPGRVVETGQEHTGRWTREEHAAFLSALKMYGKEWKKVAAKVKTRTVVQTRTHAQKYFQKLHKALSTGDGSASSTKQGTVEMGVSGKATIASQKRKKAKTSPSSSGLSRSQSTASTHAAAHLMTNLSSSGGGGSSTKSTATPSFSSSSFASSTPFSTTLGTTPAAASTASYASHGFSSASNSHNDQPLLAPQSLPSYPTGSFFGRSGGGGGGSMSIVAPDHDIAARMGKFPEPSPAATGKRKLAEIAAAQMLAGVIGGDKEEQTTTTTPPPPLLPPPSSGGDTTPPPPEGMPDLGTSTGSRKTGGGLSLQIVNPETLGVTYDEAMNRKRDHSGESPTTPWDGELEALISEKLKEEAQQEEAEAERDMKMAAVVNEVSAAPFMHPVCGPALAFGRSALHRAVCDMNVAAIQNSGTSDLMKRDEAGFVPLHTAAALSMLTPSNTNLAFDICQLLISAGAEATYPDSNGNTPLHWAARAGNERVAHLMMLNDCQTDVRNDAGETPLHWAMRTGRRGMPVVRLLLDNGALASLVDNQHKRPVDVAVEGFSDETDVCQQKSDAKGKKSNKAVKKKVQSEVIQEKREVRSNLLSLSAQSRTLVLHHPECLEHVPKSASDWECPDRVISIMQRIIVENDEPSGVFPHEITISSDFDRASLEVLSRVHSAEYLSFVNKLRKDLEKKQKEEVKNDEDIYGMPPPPPAAVPFTPMLQRKVMKEADFRNIKQADHSDTSFSVGSLRAARRAAGAVQHAVDCVLVGRNRNAFCVVRPPGHHAGIQGLLAGGESCGFCIFNNVAAGALHAISDEHELCKRCAIVDLDVHHGNGSEEIVKKCQDPARLLFFSIHLYDNDKRRTNKGTPSYKFYPGTGEEDELPHNIINVPITPLWREQNGLQKDPSSIPANTHNTRQKVKQKAASTTSSPRSIGGGDEGASTEGTKASDTESESSSRILPPKRSTPVSSPRYLAMGRQAYRRGIQDRLLPALRAFNPDLILLSTGLDPAKGDVGNARHYIGGKERMGLDLEPEDFAWATRKVLEVADICCHGRVVSVLEGGYGRTPASAAEGEEPQPLDKTVFSECALRHLQAMVDPYDTEVRFSGR